MKGEQAEAKRRFEKGAGILDTVKGHRNILEVLRFCKEPYAIMMEHLSFDFTPFGVDKKLNTLEDFLHCNDKRSEGIQKDDVAIQSSNKFIKGNKRALNWYENGTNKLFSLVCFSKYIFLQIHVLQIHVLQIQSMFYKSNPCFSNPVQSMFYNMPKIKTSGLNKSDKSVELDGKIYCNPVNLATTSQGPPQLGRISRLVVS